jgi:hypothetical protein
MTTGWQPIETAPKDGSDVLLGRTKDDGDRYEYPVRIGRWSNAVQRWIGVTANGRITQPSHWMPLPPPPANGGERR